MKGNWWTSEHLQVKQREVGGRHPQEDKNRVEPLQSSAFPVSLSSRWTPHLRLLPYDSLPFSRELWILSRVFLMRRAVSLAEGFWYQHSFISFTRAERVWGRQDAELNKSEWTSANVLDDLLQHQNDWDTTNGQGLIKFNAFEFLIWSLNQKTKSKLEEVTAVCRKDLLSRCCRSEPTSDWRQCCWATGDESPTVFNMFL